MVEKNIHFRSEKIKSKVLHSAAKLFLEKGYTNTTLRELANVSGVNYGSLTFTFKNKENILSELVGFVLDYQFEYTENLLNDKTNDKLLFYACETVLQLYMAESSEHIRELYSLSYSLSASSDVIYDKITIKLSEIFKEKYPNFSQAKFYEKELASAGIMRNYMTRPCNIFFSMEQKVKAFLENTFLLYEISREKINEIISFVFNFNWSEISQNVISNLLSYLESKT